MAHLWNEKYQILDPEHRHDLEHAAAVNELGGGMSPEQARDAAHQEYRKKHHIEAAAHHFAGMKAAMGSGDADQRKKHGMLYELHLKELGMDPYGPVPQEVLAAAAQPNKMYRFKPHLGDQFLLQKSEEIVAKAEIEPTDYSHYLPEHARNSGMQLHVMTRGGGDAGNHLAALVHNGQTVGEAWAPIHGRHGPVFRKLDRSYRDYGVSMLRALDAHQDNAPQQMKLALAERPPGWSAVPQPVQDAAAKDGLTLDTGAFSFDDFNEWFRAQKAAGKTDADIRAMMRDGRR